MSITSEDKQKMIGRFQRNHKDTGSAEVQAAILTKRIKNLTAHFNMHGNGFQKKKVIGLFEKKRLSKVFNNNTRTWITEIKLS